MRFLWSLTPGIAGYSQFHVDQVQSAMIARRLGFGICAIDSVSELYIDSLEDFFAKIADGKLGAEAAADEARFVDRDNHDANGSPRGKAGCRAKSQSHDGSSLYACSEIKKIVLHHDRDCLSQWRAAYRPRL